MCTVLVQVTGRPNPFLLWTHRRGALASLEVVHSGLSAPVAGFFLCPNKLIHSVSLRPILLGMMPELILLLLHLVRPLMKELIVLVPPQAAVAPPSIDDSWHWAFESYGLMRPTEVTEIHVYRVILQSSRDKNACTRSVTMAGPMSDPVLTLGQIIEEWWDLEIEEYDQSWKLSSCEPCLHVVSEQRLVPTQPMC